MTEAARSTCPRCQSNLVLLGGQRLCLDCAYQEDLPAAPSWRGMDTPAPLPNDTGCREPESETSNEASTPIPPGPMEALWLPPRRRRGGVSTPLGFQAGHPCPRECGGVLDEAEGALHCSGCDFRYPEAPASSGRVAVPLITDAPLPETQTPTTAEPEASPTVEVEKLRCDVERFRREVERLQNENRLLMKLAADLLHDLSKPPEEHLNVPEEPLVDEPLSLAEEPPGASSTSPSPVMNPLPEAVKSAPWWRRSS